MSLRKKRARHDFRESVFSRDCFKCKICGENDLGVLDAHHIEDRKSFENGGYVLENGITLCPNCHWLVEHGLYSTDRLYAEIASSLEDAHKADSKGKTNE